MKRRNLWTFAATFVSSISLAALADIQVFTDLAAFQSATGAAAQPPLPNLGLVGRHVASTTVGDLTFAINNGSPEIALILSDFTVLHPGIEIGLSDFEALDVTAASPVYSLGSYFVEGTGSEFCSNICPCTDATYQVRVLMNAVVVGEFQFNAPDNVLSFVGIASTVPFNRVEYRDLSEQCDNENWGQFFISPQPPCVLIDTQPVDVITCPENSAPFSVAAVGAGPFTYFWQIEASPGTWLTMGNDPIPMPCGGNSSFASALPVNSPNVDILVHGCPGQFKIRAVVDTPCGSVTSNSAFLTICPADFNCDRVVDFFDYLDFVDAFASNIATADFNGDGVIDFFDYLDFVDAFASGC